MNLLHEIIENKKAEIEKNKQDISSEYLKSYGSIRAKPASFTQALKSVPMGLIAEFKRRSPSAGSIAEDKNAAHVAEAYEDAGVQAVSLLMDKQFFGGEESDFILVRDAVELPILYKEFVIDCWQVWHARSIGASCVLLIAAVLGPKGLEEMMECVHCADMEALIEVHTSEEMAIARSLNAACIGINNRDLTTFKTSLDVSLRLREEAPADSVLVSESGIRSAEDVVKLHEAGLHAVLVGEHLLRQDRPDDAVRALMSGVWASS